MMHIVVTLSEGGPLYSMSLCKVYTSKAFKTCEYQKKMLT